jgi:DNA-binding NarL/FixJ family response regulator
VDDHPLVREGLTARINRQADLTVCGEAAEEAEAVERIKAAQPDVVIVDLSLQSGNGLDLIKKITARGGGPKMLVSSMYDETLYAERAVRAGAMGYINKQEMPEKVLEAIRRVLAGRMYLSAQMTERLLKRAVGDTPGKGLTAPSSMERLSDRELEVFRLIGQGKSTSGIAKALHLSVKTVETHRENIKNKLDLANASELAREALIWAMENG